jgi:predicted nucleotidyltransferase
VIRLRIFKELKLGANEKAAIQEAARILREQFSVENVILFGSKARDDSDPESDIDLLLLTKRPIDWKERHEIVDALFDVEMKYDVVISIIINTLHDWNDGVCTALPIHDEINRERVAQPVMVKEKWESARY